ncbi:MAG: dephospho-CoA kinase [Actinomycetota bacterium]
MPRRIIGLTGGIGSGKSTVAGLLADHGATVIDVDAVGREVAEVGGEAHDDVVDRFGRGVLGSDGELDRAALARIVFSDEAELRALEAISHPAINRTLRGMVDELERDAVVVLDMAILVESNLGRWGARHADGYDTVVTVEAPLAVRRERLVGRGMDPTDAERRIDSQASDAARRAVADHVLTNDGDLDALRSVTAGLWPELSSPIEPR